MVKKIEETLRSLAKAIDRRGIHIEESHQRLLKWVKMTEKEETKRREIEEAKRREIEEAKRREIELMKYIEDMNREKSTTSETEDSFSRIKMSENKEEQGEASILEIIEGSKMSKKVLEKLEDQAEKQQQISVMKSTVDGGRTSTKGTENEVQTEKIEMAEKVSDRNKFKIEIEEKESNQNKFELLGFSLGEKMSADAS
ncbi:hypothetical protein Csa_004705 [Cucumis sativus]|nr:hypothetical protein Csa_004705 [Cucumis sativus]